MTYGLRSLNKFSVIGETGSKMARHRATTPQIVSLNNNIRVVKPFNEKRAATEPIELAIVVTYLYNRVFRIVRIATTLNA